VELPSKEVVGLFWDLLPGFVAAWVYYGLTAHKKPSSFERIIQAFIFTAFVLPLRYGVKCLALWIGQSYSIGVWSADASLAWGVVIALGMGMLASWLTNTNALHKLLADKLQRLKITKRTAFPSEWFSAFNQDKRYVHLHLKDKRRLYGWPQEFPDHSNAGHFILMNPAWEKVGNGRKKVPLCNIERLLVPAEMVTLVEFHRWDKEVEASDEQLAQMERDLSELEDEYLKREVEADGKAKTESAVQQGE
jgi:hypothetical protein